MNEENEKERRAEEITIVEKDVAKISKNEVRKALKMMKSGNAVGPDDIRTSGHKEISKKDSSKVVGCSMRSYKARCLRNGGKVDRYKFSRTMEMCRVVATTEESS
ncbi:hypothetical protein ILYODFUR_005651 [Ilyodon furcidens]|uniref:Uncharacterized protein n=1 Tax=Ilyodon furcidens TaxID=33524 RepID=A0ABV0V0P4_9TELE